MRQTKTDELATPERGKARQGKARHGGAFSRALRPGPPRLPITLVLLRLSVTHPHPAARLELYRLVTTQNPHTSRIPDARSQMVYIVFVCDSALLRLIAERPADRGRRSARARVAPAAPMAGLQAPPQEASACSGAGNPFDLRVGLAEAQAAAKAKARAEARMRERVAEVTTGTAAAAAVEASEAIEAQSAARARAKAEARVRARVEELEDRP